MTGNMPGIAASTRETWLFGSPPNAVEAPENSFEFEVTWAWTSIPITTSQSPVEPLISLWDATGAFIGVGFRISLYLGRNGLRATRRGSQAADRGIKTVKAAAGTTGTPCSGAAHRPRLRSGGRPVLWAARNASGWH